jgi:hypothetical protein
LNGLTTSKEDTMRQHRIGTWAFGVLVAVGMLGMPGRAWGQEVGSPTPRVAGTSDEFVLAISPFAGVLRTPGVVVADVGFQRYCSGVCELIVPLNLAHRI